MLAIVIITAIGGLAYLMTRWLQKPQHFDWKKAEPRPYRPFIGKKEYKLTMGVKTLPYEDWLFIENTYETRTNERMRIFENYKEHTMLHNPVAEDAIRETYDTVFDFMCKQYPSCFRKDGGNRISNLIKGTTISPEKGDVTQLIYALGENIEEDLLIMMKNEEDGLYYLRGGTFGFPSGFDPAEKMNKPLKDIHGPVPGYKEKLEKAMDSYFDRIKSDRWVVRYNWSIQPHTELYSPGGNHADQDTVVEELNANDLDFSKVFLRVERQTLTRLPKTGAVLFSIRTYLTPLAQLRKESCIDELVPAIEALPEDMAHYKRRKAWAQAVKDYLSYPDNVQR